MVNKAGSSAIKGADSPMKEGAPGPDSGTWERSPLLPPILPEGGPKIDRGASPEPRAHQREVSEGRPKLVSR
jgi:hypothetical protein